MKKPALLEKNRLVSPLMAVIAAVLLLLVPTGAGASDLFYSENRGSVTHCGVEYDTEFFDAYIAPYIDDGYECSTPDNPVPSTTPVPQPSVSDDDVPVVVTTGQSSPEHDAPAKADEEAVVSVVFVSEPDPPLDEPEVALQTASSEGCSWYVYSVSWRESFDSHTSCLTDSEADGRGVRQGMRTVTRPDADFGEDSGTITVTQVPDSDCVRANPQEALLGNACE